MNSWKLSPLFQHPSQAVVSNSKMQVTLHATHRTLTALRAWCKRCLLGWSKPDMLHPGIVGMRGSNSYGHTTATMDDIEYSACGRARARRPRPPFMPSVHYCVAEYGLVSELYQLVRCPSNITVHEQTSVTRTTFPIS